MRCVYTVVTPADVSVSTTPKTVLRILGTSAFGVDLLGFWLGYDGSAVAEPTTWELCRDDGTTGGTSTAATAQQEGGRVITTGFVGAYNFTAESTVLTVIKSGLLSPNGGYYEYEYPPDSTPDSDVSDGFALRITSPTAVNARAGFRFART
jgi:hypothetical protein